MTKKQNETSWSDQAMEVAIGHLLRVGVTVSALVVVTGGVLYLLQQRGARPDYTIFRGTAEPLGLTLANVVHGTKAGDGHSVILLGLLLLVMTPVARVLFAVFGFLRERDWMYTAISAGVFAILLYSLLLER
ncbi:MAG TPA: DUF1634 domain-containing protein [Acidisarcina sp.]